MKERTLRHLAATLLVFTALFALAATGAELIAVFHGGSHPDARLTDSTHAGEVSQHGRPLDRPGVRRDMSRRSRLAAPQWGTDLTNV